MSEDQINYRVPVTYRKKNSVTYDRNAFKPAAQVLDDDMEIIIREFMNQAAINMGKEAVDFPKQTIDAVLNIVRQKYNFLPVCYICSALIRGSLGELSPGRLVPKTINQWMMMITEEYNKNFRSRKLNEEYSAMTTSRVNMLPYGKAINMKFDLLHSGRITSGEYDRMDIKELAECINRNLDLYEIAIHFGITIKSLDNE